MIEADGWGEERGRGEVGGADFYTYHSVELVITPTYRKDFNGPALSLPSPAGQAPHPAHLFYRLVSTTPTTLTGVVAHHQFKGR